MDISYDDLSKEQKEGLSAIAKDLGYSEEEIIEEFNEEASDADNVLDFFDDDLFLEDMLRRDDSLLSDYLEFIISKVT